MAMRWRPEEEFSLTPVAPEVWLARHPLTYFGFRVTTAMTLVRLPSGGLWVHSPNPLHDALKAEVDALGPVEHIVVPNRMHHLYAQECAAQYPAARLYVAPDLGQKNPAFAGLPLIPPDAEAPWGQTIGSVFVEGNAELAETVFFHRPSRTLILTDLAVHMGPWDSFGTRLYTRLSGCYDRVGLSFALRSLFKDRGAARRSVRRILEWDFTRIVLGHGPVVTENARATFEAAFSWLLRNR